MNLCVIPARGGSKRIPLKNIKLFCGKPMIVWSIEAAKTSGCFDRVIVSTDDKRIRDIALSNGAEVPFIRPHEFSTDNACIIPVVAHAINWLNEQNDLDINVCCIFATAPFLLASDLVQGLETLKKTGADYAFSVTSYPFPIQRAIRILKENRVEMFQPEHFHTRSQDLETAWHDAGQFYWGKANSWINNKDIFGSNSAPVPIPRYRVQDIDTEEDWDLAELMFKAQFQK